MNIDNTQPWEESKEKLPKLGKVLSAMIEIEKRKTTDKDSVLVYLTDTQKNVNDQLAEFNTTITALISAHTAKKGLVHGEDKNTIGLDKKENLGVATVADVTAKIYKHAFLTPETLNVMADSELNVDDSLYVRSGVFPLSYGVTLGRALFNQRYTGQQTTLSDVSPAGPCQSLLMTEEGYLLFADHATGYDSEFSEGGTKAPIGTTMISVINNNLSMVKGIPASLNDVTASDLFVANATGLEFGFGADRGNYYDSNFHPTVTAVPTNISTSIKQSIESTLFNPTLIYKPEGTYTFRNYDLTKHNFTEMTPYMDGIYPFNDVSVLSSDNFCMHTANCRVVQESNIWGIEFDILSGDIGIPDWYLDNLRRNSNKIMSKRAEYKIAQTTISSLTGFEGALSFIRSSNGQLPVGFSVNRGNLQNNNFAAGKRYASVFIPIEALIKGFNGKTAAIQKAFTDRIDRDLLKRITLAWDNKLALKGVMRIPFYVKNVGDTTKASHMWVDLSYAFTLGDEGNKIAFSALNFVSANRPSLDANNDVVVGGKFKQWSTDITETPLHPKVMGGAFVETGGHVKAYTVGHRQYLCFYVHQVTSTLNWIKSDLTPVITDSKIKDINMFPGNGFYGDALRVVPTGVTTAGVNYLSYMRNKKGKYDYATFTLPFNFDLYATGVNAPISFKWIGREGEKELPALVENVDLTTNSLNITGCVFSEGNEFVGSLQLPFNGTVQVPNSKVVIDDLLMKRAIRNSRIVNPYAIFFYYKDMLYWVIADRYGTKNSDGYDLCIGSVRVDIYTLAANSYELRPLPTMNELYRYGKLFASEVPSSFYGRNKESFDDVFIIPDGTNKKAFINYPILPGKYFSISLVRDNLGYFYPGAFNETPLDMKTLNGYGVSTPHKFYPNYSPPIMGTKKFYHFKQSLYGLTEYSSTGLKSTADYYMGWKNAFPLYVIGSNITVNGRSLLVDKSINLDNYTVHEGPVFITYDDDGGYVYTPKYNPNGGSTEPTTSAIFAGFWYKSKDVYTFSYHAMRGIASIEYADFLNGLLPTVDGIQMATNSMGSTFPLFLGEIKGDPRQYFFKK